MPSSSSLNTLLTTHVAGLLARRIHPMANVDPRQIGRHVEQLTAIIDHGSTPMENIMDCLSEIESLVMANPAACLPLLAAVERRAAGVLDTMPMLAERLNHIRKGADIAELFSMEKLLRLEAALRDYQETNL